MQAISSIGSKGKIFTDIIDEQTLTDLAKGSGFSHRKPRKISAYAMLLSYMNFINSSAFSFHNWSIDMSRLIGQRVSKQAIHKRMNEAFVRFSEQVLSFILNRHLGRYVDKSYYLFRNFGNVYLQDATHFSLPLHLAHLFPGNTTNGTTRAVAKVVTVFNLSKGCFSAFNLTSFLEPDVSSLGLIYGKLKAGDLIIRDLGYFAVGGFDDLMSKGVYFLSRLKQNVVVCNDQNKTPVNLARFLKKHKSMDMQILLSVKKPIPVRIVAQPLPKHIAAERIRKARIDKRNKRTNHNKDYYYLLGYAIYITNVETSVWTAQDVIKAYKCRWTIEILFKSWKSNLNAHYISPDRYASEITVKTHFYLLLIYVSAFIMPILIKIENRIRQNRDKIQTSILKLTNYINLNFIEIINSPQDSFIDNAIYYTKYDSRNDRLNAVKFINQCT